MLITDIRKDFYQQLLDQRILLLVHCDVDAICTSAILQELFRGDHVLYTLIPVKVISDTIWLILRMNVHTNKEREIIEWTCLISVTFCLVLELNFLIPFSMRF